MIVVRVMVVSLLVDEVDEQATVEVVTGDEEERDVVVMLLEREIASWFNVLSSGALYDWGIWTED